jgi:hypothetical protein
MIVVTAFYLFDDLNMGTKVYIRVQRSEFLKTPIENAIVWWQI